MIELLTEIARVLPDGGDWCSLDKATAMASIVVGLRPLLIVEIGVWQGGSLVPMLLAQKHVERGRAIAIDPWSPDESTRGQHQKADSDWWSGVDHKAAYRKFVARLEVLGLAHLCTIMHRASDACEPPMSIDLLHIDGNHSEQAIRDVERFSPRVPMGGVLVLDDLNWSTGAVETAHKKAKTIGFRDLYQVGNCGFMQRVREP